MNERDLSLSHGSIRLVDAGDGDPLVLLHGLGGSWHNWEANIAGLAGSHRVIAPDLPGFGQSDPLPGPLTIERYVDTLMELLDALALQRATFVGNSLGGLLTIEAAARHMDRVAAAVLVCSGGIPLTSRRHRMVTIPGARALNGVLRKPGARRALAASPRARRLIAGMIFHDPAGLPDDVLTEALDGLSAPAFDATFAAGSLYDARERAPHVTCPTLILWGRDDRLLPVAMGEELHRLIRGSRLEIWDAAGHCPMIEQPERFDELVAGFRANASDAQPVREAS